VLAGEAPPARAGKTAGTTNQAPCAGGPRLGFGVVRPAGCADFGRGPRSRHRETMDNVAAGDRAGFCWPGPQSVLASFKTRSKCTQATWAATGGRGGRTCFRVGRPRFGGIARSALLRETLGRAVTDRLADGRQKLERKGERDYGGQQAVRTRTVRGCSGRRTSHRALVVLELRAANRNRPAFLPGCVRTGGGQGRTSVGPGPRHPGGPPGRGLVSCLAVADHVGAAAVDRIRAVWLAAPFRGGNRRHRRCVRPRHHLGPPSFP